MEQNIKDIKEKIDAYVKGALSEDDIMELWTEFAKTPSLLDDLELEVGVKKLIEDGVTSSKTSQKSKTLALPSWTWHAAAAAILLLVAFIQIFQVTTKTELSQFVVASISPDQTEAGDGVRSDDMINTSPDSLLNLGFSALISGNTNQALALYNEVITNYDNEPYGSKAFLNKGIISYNEGNYLEAIAAFDESLLRVSDNKMIEEKAFWFKGNAQINIEELILARDTILKAYTLNGVFRKPAFLLLQKLNYDLGYVDYEDLEEEHGEN